MRYGVLIIGLCLCANVFARQAPVEERYTVARRIARLEAMLENNQQLDFSQRLDSFQNTLQTLQGQVEELTHQLAEMTAKQRNLYADLDNRLSKAQDHNAANPHEKGDKIVPFAVDTEDALKERAAYQNAYKLLRDKKYPEAITALKAYVKQYPNGVYSPNAYYWLGEVYHLEGKLKEARDAFKIVVDKFPKHPKAADALLKLGYVYSAIGDNKAATLALEDVSNRYKGTSLAQLADTRLKRIARN